MLDFGVSRGSRMFKHTFIGFVLLLSTPLFAQQAPSPVLLEALDKVQQLSQDNRELRGQLEVLQHQIQLQSQRLDALEALSISAPPTITQTTPTPPSPLSTAPKQTTQDSKIEPTTPSPSDQAEPLFAAAQQALKMGENAAANNAFNAFLSSYPQHAQYADALAGSGESAFAMQDYASARDALLRLGREYNSYPRLPELMLKLGDAFNKLNDPIQAQSVYQQLITRFPQSTAAKTAQQTRIK